jgi:hypothetical protein
MNGITAGKVFHLRMEYLTGEETAAILGQPPCVGNGALMEEMGYEAEIPKARDDTEQARTQKDPFFHPGIAVARGLEPGAKAACASGMCTLSL